MEKNVLDGRWPLHGANKDKITAILEDLEKDNIEWGKTAILGFPSMKPHPIGLETFHKFQDLHTNALLTHTRGHGEKGFDGVKDIERDLIAMVADLLGDVRQDKQDKNANFDGYVTSGGTEANIMGLWIGRNKLTHGELSKLDKRIAVLATSASHYSLMKACNVVGLGEGEWLYCQSCSDYNRNSKVNKLLAVKAGHIFRPAYDGSGLHFVKSNPDGSINLDSLELMIQHLRLTHKIDKFIIFLNQGTTLTGAMDDVAEIGKIISACKLKYSNQVSFYMHVDAAYGGLVYPFVLPDYPLVLSVPEVDSITIDPYKMGMCPIAEGIFICRKNLQFYIERRAGYVQNEMDDTLVGSRSGAYPAACWSVFRTVGRSGFEEMHKASVVKAQYLHTELQTVDKIHLLPQQLNMVSFLLPADLSEDLIIKFEKHVIKKYYVMWSWFNTDPQNPESHPRMLVKCNITKDVKKQWLKNFIHDVKLYIN